MGQESAKPPAEKTPQTLKVEGLDINFDPTNGSLSVTIDQKICVENMEDWVEEKNKVEEEIRERFKKLAEYIRDLEIDASNEKKNICVTPPTDITQYNILKNVFFPQETSLMDISSGNSGSPFEIKIEDFLGIFSEENRKELLKEKLKSNGNGENGITMKLEWDSTYGTLGDGKLVISFHNENQRIQKITLTQKNLVNGFKKLKEELPKILKTYRCISVTELVIEIPDYGNGNNEDESIIGFPKPNTNRNNGIEKWLIEDMGFQRINPLTEAVTSLQKPKRKIEKESKKYYIDIKKFSEILSRWTE